MSFRTKAISVVILALLTFGLAYVLWIQTKLLVVSLVVLAVFVIAIYFIVTR